MVTESGRGDGYGVATGLVSLVLVVFAIGVGGCGGEAASRSSTVGKVSSAGYLKNDGDQDKDDGYLREDAGNGIDDATLLASYGKPAGAATSETVAGLVRRYYAAAAANDDAKACELLDSSLVGAFVSGEGQAAEGAGAVCAAAVAPLFKGEHAQLLADEVSTMGVTELRVKGNVGLAVLGFKKAEERELLVQREDGVWKIGALIDGQLP